jgi:hypothetical protein
MKKLNILLVLMIFGLLITYLRMDAQYQNSVEISEDLVERIVELERQLDACQ